MGRGCARWSSVVLWAVTACTARGAGTDHDATDASGTAVSGSEGRETREPACSPGDVESCTCEDGSNSQRQCLDSGELGACDCLARCGDGVLGDGEACDDANLEQGDGCDAECRFESGTVLFDIDVGELFVARLEPTSDGRLALLREDLTLVTYDVEGAEATQSVLPPLTSPPESAFSDLTGLPRGEILVAFGGCAGVYAACDRWFLFDADGNLRWEETFWNGYPSFRPVRVSSADGAIISLGHLQLGADQPWARALRRYSTDAIVEWDVLVEENPNAYRLRSGPDGDLAMLASEGLVHIDPSTGELLGETPLPVGANDAELARGDRIYAAVENDDGELALASLNAGGIVDWSTPLPLVGVMSISVLADGRIAVGGTRPLPLGEDDDLFVVNEEGVIEASHNVTGWWAYDTEVGPQGFLYVLALQDGVGVPARLVKLAP